MVVYKKQFEVLEKTVEVYSRHACLARIIEMQEIDELETDQLQIMIDKYFKLFSTVKIAQFKHKVNLMVSVVRKYGVTQTIPIELLQILNMDHLDEKIRFHYGMELLCQI